MTTLGAFRQRVWIARARVIVKTPIKRGCRSCQTPAPVKLPLFSNYPDARISQRPPFEAAGLDYFGPMAAKLPEGQKRKVVRALQ